MSSFNLPIKDFDNLLHAIGKVEVLADRALLNARLNAGSDATELKEQLDSDKVEIKTAISELYDSLKVAARRKRCDS